MDNGQWIIVTNCRDVACEETLRDESGVMSADSAQRLRGNVSGTNQKSNVDCTGPTSPRQRLGYESRITC
jgi:hypothetical protein